MRMRDLKWEAVWQTKMCFLFWCWAMEHPGWYVCPWCNPVSFPPASWLTSYSHLPPFKGCKSWDSFSKTLSFYHFDTKSVSPIRYTYKASGMQKIIGWRDHLLIDWLFLLLHIVVRTLGFSTVIQSLSSICQQVGVQIGAIFCYVDHSYSCVLFISTIPV